MQELRVQLPPQRLPWDVKERLKPDVSKRECSMLSHNVLHLGRGRLLSIAQAINLGWTLCSFLCLPPQSTLITLPSNSRLNLPPGPLSPDHRGTSTHTSSHGTAMAPNWFPTSILPPPSNLSQSTWSDLLENVNSILIAQLSILQFTTSCPGLWWRIGMSVGLEATLVSC